MRVLLVGRPMLAIRGGGDKVAILKTQEYLKKLGVDAQVTYDIYPDYKGFEIAHLFTLSTWHAAKKAREYGIPFVVSTIWDLPVPENWVLKEEAFHLRLLKQLLAKNKNLRDLFNLARNVWGLSQGSLSRLPKAWQVSWCGYIIRRNELSARRQILEWAACLVPPSEFCIRFIKQKFGSSYWYTVIPHGVDPGFAEETENQFIRQYGLGDFVLCVSAGFGYRKNQLSLIRALKGTSLPLVIVATPRTGAEKRYFKKCQSEADSTVIFLSRLPAKMLASAYKAAHVFALPSTFECFGLVYFEAAAAGCNVVATTFSPAKEYFRDFAWYCNPYDISSIRQAVLEAYNTPKRKELQEHVLRNFTWERAAKMTLDVYKRVLNKDI